MTLHTHPELFKTIIEAAAQPIENLGLGIYPLFIEKDYWICRSLQLLSRHDQEHRAIFKGGTSLTKAYHIGMRFSEDIDIAISDANQLTGNQLKSTIKRTAMSMSDGLNEVVYNGMTSKGSHYYKAYYAYPQLFDRQNQGAVRSGELLIEINSFGNPYPWEMRTITPFVTEFLSTQKHPDLIEQYDLNAFDIPVLDCRRTLTEKLVSLIRCSLADQNIEQLKGHIRHFYDLHHLMQDDIVRTYITSPDFPKDFENLLEHDRQQFVNPTGWQKHPITESPLITDLHATWIQLIPKYTSELPALAYHTIPSAEVIEHSLFDLLALLR